MIRPATVDDIPALLELGERFAGESGMSAAIGFDPESVERMLRQLIESGILLVCPGGMIGGLVYGHPFNNACVVFQEMFWRAEQGHGLDLLNAAHEHARSLGATHSAMMLAEGMDPERAERLYRRLGYRALDRSFIKEL
jgi:GNAT superfamily N-acetyltransferase